MNPAVTLISCTDNRELAWRMSRPNIPYDASIDLHDLSKADFGINDSRRDTLHFTSSVLFRELLTIVRGIDVWAQTSRVKPIGDSKISGEYNHTLDAHEVNDLIKSLGKRVDAGESQDVLRREVPVIVSTQYYVNANFRTWVTFLKCLRSLAPALYDIYGILIQDALKIEDLNYYMYDMKGGMIKTVSLSDADRAEPSGSSSYLGTTTVKFDTTLGHASHFVRHQKNLYRSTIWDYASLPLSGHTKVNLNSPVTVITTMPESSYQTILSHRADWLADWGLWYDFVKAGTENLSTEEFWNLLDPVENFASDNMERINLTDPGLPDPRLIDNPEVIGERIYKEGSNYIAERWVELLHAGYIKDDPTNELRIQYENNLKSKG